MKIKATGRSKNVVLKMGAGDSALPPIAVPEVQLKTILVPVDFSESSRKALSYAVCLAKQFSAEVVLLHVLEAPPPQIEIMESALTDTSFRQEAEEQLSEWQRESASRVSTKALIRSGKAPHHEIVTAAGEENSDLIIMGNHGRTGLARALIGSTAELVVRHAPCPVLVIREREHDFVASQEPKQPTGQSS